MISTSGILAIRSVSARERVQATDGVAGVGGAVAGVQVPVVGVFDVPAAGIDGDFVRDVFEESRGRLAAIAGTLSDEALSDAPLFESWLFECCDAGGGCLEAAITAGASTLPGRRATAGVGAPVDLAPATLAEEDEAGTAAGAATGDVAFLIRFEGWSFEEPS